MVVVCLLTVFAFSKPGRISGDATGYPNSCADSDNGISLAMKGSVSGYFNGLEYFYEDYCMSNVRLWEYRCEGTVWNGDVYTCPTGCSDGSCI
jgi:hypothetical protein